MPKSLYQILKLGLLLAALTACGKKAEVTDAVDEALYYLSKGPECQKAIDVLEDVGRQNDDPRYLATLASAYACRAGFSELILFDEVDTITAGGANFLKSLTQLSGSEESEADSDSYQDLREAINITLYAGGISIPSVANRVVALGSRQGGNLSLQALYMILAQLGKYMHFYGNVSSSGVKGGGAANVDEQGAAASQCFFTYTDTDAVAAINGNPATGTCNATNDPGHPDLGVTTAAEEVITKRRMCEGIVLINNMVDILSNTTLSDNDSLGDIGSIIDDVQTALDTAEATYAPRLDDLIGQTSQDVCEEQDIDDIQLFFASIMELGLST